MAEQENKNLGLDELGRLSELFDFCDIERASAVRYGPHQGRDEEEACPLNIYFAHSRLCEWFRSRMREGARGNAGVIVANLHVSQAPGSSELLEL